MADSCPHFDLWHLFLGKNETAESDRHRPIPGFPMAIVLHGQLGSSRCLCGENMSGKELRASRNALGTELFSGRSSSGSHGSGG